MPLRRKYYKPRSKLIAGLRKQSRITMRLPSPRPSGARFSNRNGAIQPELASTIDPEDQDRRARAILAEYGMLD